MIRIYEAAKEDIPKIVDCAREYTEAMPNNVVLNPTFLIRSWEQFYDCGMGTIFLADEDGRTIGGIGMLRFQQPFTGEWTAVEQFWYMAEGRRGVGVKLYQFFEKWAKDNGCTRLAMIYLPFSMPDKLDTFYRRQGYSLLEMHYEKEI